MTKNRQSLIYASILVVAIFGWCYLSHLGRKVQPSHTHLTKNERAAVASSTDVSLRNNQIKIGAKSYAASPDFLQKSKIELRRLLGHEMESLNIPINESEKLLDILSIYWLIAIEYQSTLLQDASPEDGRAVFTIPIYPETGIEIRNMLEAEIRNQIGPAFSDDTLLKLNPEIDFIFKHFGMCPQQITVDLNGENYIVKWEVGAIEDYEPEINATNKFVSNLATYQVSRSNIAASLQLRFLQPFLQKKFSSGK